MRRIAILTLTAALACSFAEPDHKPHVVQVALNAGKLVAPNTIAAGWVRLHVEEDGAGHILVAFRLRTTLTHAEITSFLASLDTARMTPATAIALGGPEVGDSGEVIVELPPGQYILACLSRNRGRRHANLGEWQLVEAKGPARGEAPRDSVIELSMVDFTYHTNAPWQSGSRIIKVVNSGREDHQVRIDRLRTGASLQQWLDAEDKAQVSNPVAGVARTGPGQTVYLPFKLQPGTYVLYCLIPAVASGQPHAVVGMIRAVLVE